MGAQKHFLFAEITGVREAQGMRHPHTLKRDLNVILKKKKKKTKYVSNMLATLI